MNEAGGNERGRNQKDASAMAGSETGTSATGGRETGAGAYDPEARRDTPLARKLVARIRREGPITATEYVRSCLTDAEHGYYVKQRAIGADGDFVTAPEITQVFGEIVGAWVAVVWQMMGAPARVRLVELGPGRGTLLADVARVLTRVPPLAGAVALELVETSEALRARQKETLAGSALPVSWYDRLEPRPGVATILLANEFLDCLAPAAWVKTAGRWGRRLVTLDDAGGLQFATEPLSGAGKHIAIRFPDAPDGSIYEEVASESFAEALRDAVAGAAFAGLLLDYGPAEDGLGDTLQAVRGHASEHPLTSPGEADLTTHVKFSWYKDDLAAEGFAIDGPVTQAEFLGALGIMQRASKLMSANPAHAHEIEAGVARIMAVPGMGDRFKALGVRSPGLPPLPGF